MPERGRIGEVLRTEGIAGLWWRGLGVTVYRRLLFVARPNDRPAPGRPVDGLEMAELESGGLAAYARLRPDTPAAEVERRLGAGQRCLLVWAEGEPVSARWFTLARAEAHYLGLGFELAPGVAYVYDVYTSRAARGRRISEAVRYSYEVALREQGVDRLLGTVMPGNEGGLGLVRGAGYEPIGHVGSLRAGTARLPIRRIEPGYLGDAHRLAVSWRVSPPGG